MTDREQTIHGLKQVVAWLEANPEFEVADTDILIRCWTKADLTAFVRALPNPVQKYSGGMFFFAKHHFTDTVSLYGGVEHEKVCRRVEKGTRVVPAQEEHEEPVYEWIWDDALLAAK